eukprot:CAMPEP_0204059576 /NCGR_PEP_ID=MMETSP0360-20130528/138163_1 /ASSEMBLY_ACC=CAM_ASM_000342 /TAXON_ID=268821 /ORGANISM="Scrippsiella Hangoei, Strain SHTV-5" /LENGTH=60 /DNA_ID=CAMNT_0051007191 /DNA_START=112 /DNA_END=291 /DNA_ORIENTATION=+
MMAAPMDTFRERPAAHGSNRLRRACQEAMCATRSAILASIATTALPRFADSGSAQTNPNR